MSKTQAADFEELEVIYWEDLDEKKKAILDVFERHQEPLLWTSEILEKVEFTRPTLLHHLNELENADLVGKKENQDTVWWRMTETQILPGSRTGLTGRIRRWFPTSSASAVDRWANRAALFGASLALFGMFLMIVSFYLLVADINQPSIFGLALFDWGLLAGLIGFFSMTIKFGLFLGESANVLLNKARN